MTGTPAGWLATELAEHLAARYDEPSADDAGAQARWVDLDGLLADGAAALVERHRRLVDDGAPPAAAATYVAEWVTGVVAAAVGWALTTTGAGLVVVPGSLRWREHPGGWFDRVMVDGPKAPPVVVAPGHPWAGRDGVETVADADAVAARAVLALVDALGPVVEACRALAPVGRTGLWNEVADALGGAAAHQRRVPVTPAMVAVLERAVRVPGAPWKARPRLAFADSALLGPVHVAQKGGCCLAYTKAEVEGPAAAELDEDRRAYLERFPRLAGTPRYCTTCSFRDAADCDARQVFWQERLSAAGTAH